MRARLGLGSGLGVGVAPRASGESGVCAAGPALGAMAAVAAGLAVAVHRSLLGDPAQARSNARPGDGLRARWRCAGVLVHPRWGVPSHYPDGALALEVYAQRIVIRRPWSSPITVRAAKIQSLERVRRVIGGPTTRIGRGMDRPRIDLDLDEQAHAKFVDWWRSRKRVERIVWPVAEVQALSTTSNAGASESHRVGWALRRHGDDPWLWVGAQRGRSLPFWSRKVWVERFFDGGRLHHLESCGVAVPVYERRIDASLTERLRRLPEVARLVSEVDDFELIAAFDGSTRYR